MLIEYHTFTVLCGKFFLGAVMKVLGAIRNTVAQTLFDESCTHFESHTALSEDKYLSPRFSRLRVRTANLLTAIKAVKGTEALESADSARDADFKRVLSGLKGYRDLQLGEKSEAAEQVLKIIERHGGASVLTAPYADETALLFSIEQDLSTEGAKANLEKLDGVAEVLKKVFDENRAVKELSVANEKAAAAFSGAENATAIKKELISFFNGEILSYLELMKNSDDEYKALLDELSKATEKANASVPKRASAKKAEEKQPQAVQPHAVL